MLRDLLQSDDCAEKLKALADAERLRIVQCLQANPMHVGALAEKLGRDIAIISHHLGILREAGLVESTREGKYLRYALSEKVSSEPDSLNLGCCKLGIKPGKSY